MPAFLGPTMWALLTLAPPTTPREPLGRAGGSWMSQDPDAASMEPGVVARMGSTRLRHGSSIRSLIFSANGGLIVSSDLMGTVTVWEVATGRLVRRWDLPLRPRGPVRFSPDGQRVVCPFAEDLVVSYDVRTGTAAREPRGDKLPEGRVPARSDCGRFTATVDSESTVTVRDARTGGEDKLAAGEHSFSWIGAVRFAPDAASLFVGDADGGILRLDRSTGAVLRRYGPFLFYPPDVVAVSPDGACLAIAARNRIHLIDVATGVERFPDPERFSQPPAMHVASDGHSLVLSGGYTAPRQEVWDWAPTRLRSRTSIPLSGWQAGTPILTRHAPGGRVRVGFGGDTQFDQHDTTQLRFCEPDGTLLWTVRKGLSGRGGYAFSADGALVCVVEGKGLGVYEALTGRQVHYLGYPAGMAAREWAGGVEFTPDGSAVVTAHQSGLIYWPLAAGVPPRECPLPPGDSLDGQEGLMKLSPDGRLAVVSTDRCDLVAIELATLRERFRLSIRRRGPVSSYAFLADCRYLAVANGDSTVTVHDLAVWPPAESAGPDAATWSDLASPDAGRADRVMRALTTRPVQVPGWLREQFRAEARGDDRAAQLVGQLDAPRYAVRERAQAELVRLGHTARPALMAASRTQVSPESRQRLDSLLNGVRGPDLTLDGLRADRAVEVLERVRTPEAVRLLKEWSAGPVGATRADSARSALARIEPPR
ncbi:MAG TPA: WD40 repeat domain-containing protein [Gemmataceae bacterium]|nr:WD40 repeat domain-containing protein [Gemmataceae bacterium]